MNKRKFRPAWVTTQKARVAYKDDAEVYIVFIILGCIAYWEFYAAFRAAVLWYRGWEIKKRQVYSRLKLSRDNKLICFRTTPEMMQICETIGLFGTWLFNDTFFAEEEILSGLTTADYQYIQRNPWEHGF